MSPAPLTVPGVARLRAWDHGGEGLPLVLFLHGFLDTGRSFDDVCAPLLGRARCVALDWRGHGQSQMAGPGASFHLLDHVKDLTLALEDLEDRFGKLALLVGHSLGGNTALLYAGALPDRVPRLLLLDALGPPAEDPSEQPERLGHMLALLSAKKPFAVVADKDEAIARLMRNNRGLTAAGAERMVRHALVPREDGGWAFPFARDLRGPNPVRHPEEMWLTLCARVTARTVVVRATNGYVPEGDPIPGRIAALGATMLTWDAPHHVHVEQPDNVAQLIGTMLDAGA